ncbi:coiled-coil domain-containing protein 1 [Harpegnathos saltator]|uniref:DUF4773 domain-containing protein n=1 Tax=Harpegnathos saltator TaxID=610380 RepID=E2BPM9_HARSA|nr:coiled-coil domain-containing protein 1 [Harpegnathos saltator]EFN82433.1 hypothetical protein EAI_01577 [Harpegnathos saltator]
MLLSTIFELLLILLLVAFAAYGRVIDRDEVIPRAVRAADNSKQSDISLSTMSLKQAADSVNRYCTCNENICNCCRDFHIPVVQLKGPGCASLQYLQGDNLAMQLSFGDNILTSTMVNGKSPRPVCVPLPGGFTKFCGRIYSIQRDAKNHFKACLGLELQSATELEASLRVSCFRFGPDGLKLRPAEPLPVVEAESSTEEDDEDDFFGLGSDDDEDEDDEDDEYDRPSLNSVPDASGVDDAQEADDEDDDDDLLGIGALLDIFTGDDDATTKRPKATTVAPLLQFTIPILTRPTTPAPLEDYELSTSGNNVSVESSNDENSTQEDSKPDEEEETESLDNENATDENQEDEVTEASNKIVFFVKPDKVEQSLNKVKKGVVGNKKKPTVTSTSINAIDEPEKPAKKPIKNEEHEDDDDDDDDDEDDILDDEDDEDDEILDDEYDKDDEDEDEDDEDKLDDEKHEDLDDDEDEKAEDLSILDDDDDEEEDAMLTAIMGTGKNKKGKGDTTSETNTDEDDSDYGLGLDFLARKRHPEGNRQSKITRL